MPSKADQIRKINPMPDNIRTEHTTFNINGFVTKPYYNGNMMKYHFVTNYSVTFN